MEQPGRLSEADIKFLTDFLTQAQSLEQARPEDRAKIQDQIASQFYAWSVARWKRQTKESPRADSAGNVMNQIMAAMEQAGPQAPRRPTNSVIGELMQAVAQAKLSKEQRQEKAPNDGLNQKIAELMEQLELNKKELEETKAQLEVADSKFSDVANLQKQLEQEKEDHKKTKTQLQMAEGKKFYIKDLENAVDDLEEKLEQEKEEHEKTKTQLQIAETTKISDVKHLENEVRDFEEQLEQEKKDHKKAKYDLEDLEIKLLNRDLSIEELKKAVQSLAIRKSSKDHFEAEKESKFEMLEMKMENMNKKFDDYKLENDKKFDDLKEQISKGKEPKIQKLKKKIEELKSENADLEEHIQFLEHKKDNKIQELEKTIRRKECRLESENANLQEKLSDSIDEIVLLEHRIEDFQQTDVEKNEKIQELEATIRQNECKLDEFEKRDLDYEELKKKYEEAVVQLEDMDELEMYIEKLKLEHYQLQQQHQKLKQQNEQLLQQQQQQLQQQTQQQTQQQQQQFDETSKKDHQAPYDDPSLSTKLKELLSLQEKYLHALFSKETRTSDQLLGEWNRCYYSLSEADTQKFNEVGAEHYKDIRKMYK